jgi:hypothetical protein
MIDQVDLISGMCNAIKERGEMIYILSGFSTLMAKISLFYGILIFGVISPVLLILPNILIHPAFA